MNATLSARSVLARQRWLILRRIVQLGWLGLFLVGPLTGIWLVRGNIASSLTLDTLPLSDPFILLQSLAAGNLPHATAILGGLIVVTAYLCVGGRSYCAWVCPVNIVTDAAAWLRRRLGLKGGLSLPAQTRNWLIAAVLITSAITGSIAWEWINPVTSTFRAIVFGLGSAWIGALIIFVLDAFVGSRLWCGHLCPVGAFYSLLGSVAVVRVAATHRDACDDCMDCFTVCPEPQVIRPALKQQGQIHPLVLDADCSNCGRCIDVCNKQVFRMTTRFNRSAQ